MSEQNNLKKDILVISKNKIKNINLGFTKITKKEILELVKQGEYRPRSLMEKDENYKQFIPYIAIKKKNELFIYQRSKTGGEDRLFNKWTLGVGGHVDKPDSLISATIREIKEELDLEVAEKDLNFVGFINSNTTDVDIVHLGIAIIVEVSDNFDFSKGELDKLINRNFYTEEILDKKSENFEEWSKIFYNEYLKNIL